MKRLSSTLALAFALSGCFDGSADPDPAWQSPKGPVAANAAEAWEDPPPSVPSVSAQQILAACIRAGECSTAVMQEDQATRAGLVDLCVHDAVFSGERAIPLSGFNLSNERVEYWVQCVLGAQGDCGAVDACRTERDSRIQCQEDGCYATEKLAVSCNGTVATLKGQSGTSMRDCSRAYAECDPSSLTGCTDRHFTQCPADPVGDHCDGAVRLGCDGENQVSYHDCTRLGGSCGAEADGSQGCVYPSAAACWSGGSVNSSCKGGDLKACVLGQELSQSSGLCVDGG